MIEYEIQRSAYGSAYDRNGAIKMSVASVKQDAPRRGVSPDDIDWVDFARYLTGEAIPAQMPDGIRYCIVLRMRFEDEATAVYFKMQYGDLLKPKFLPDEHFR